MGGFVGVGPTGPEERQHRRGLQFVQLMKGGVEGPTTRQQWAHHDLEREIS